MLDCVIPAGRLAAGLVRAFAIVASLARGFLASALASVERQSIWSARSSHTSGGKTASPLISPGGRNPTFCFRPQRAHPRHSVALVVTSEADTPPPPPDGGAVRRLSGARSEIRH